MNAISRSTTSQEVLRVLRSRIVDGEYPARTRLDENSLAAELGVSRTPLREALAGLEREGLVRHEPYKGRVVTDSEDEVVEELFPILAVLEGLAITSTGTYPEQILDELDALNTRLAKPGASGRQRHALDAEWHSLLVAHCGNARLIELIARQRALASRYDGGADRGIAAVELTVREHASVVAALRENDASAAARLVSSHWHNGIETIRKWRSARPRSKTR
ncbi:GntR family transcriptional regulator [Dokdonella sp.]|uniref:GntR family transcriptional regulator n=1 Tax=Dokdonella sp. TaxID=2291710 RepID=UPI003529B2BD